MFGLLGAGNTGNDGSLEAALEFVTNEQPDVILGLMCTGHENVFQRYGIRATPLHWHQPSRQSGPKPSTTALKLTGKLLDPFRILRWVRQFDIVIVPGTGVLETTLPIRPWGFPLSLFLLATLGKLSRTRVVLINVGANVTTKRLTRTLLISTARISHYVSYRDATSVNAMNQMGVKVSTDRIYPDLIFSLASPPTNPVESRTVGVGVMNFHGGNDDRPVAQHIHNQYVESMKRFVGWLVASGHRVRLFVGDDIDDTIAAEVVADALARHGDADPTAVATQPVSSISDLMTHMSTVEIVVATRYHNVLCALKLAKPTLSISYSAKSDDAMSQWGLTRFCHPARAVQVDTLIEQFQELEDRAHEFRESLRAQTAAQEELLQRQRSALSGMLFEDQGLEMRHRTAHGSTHED